jgi:dGTPase
LKHCSRADAQALERHEPGGVGMRFLRKQQPSLEAQLCNLADEIAYNAHDIDDGVRSGLITLDQLQTVALFQQYRSEALVQHPHLGAASAHRRLMYEAIRRMLSAQVYDLISATQEAVRQADPASPDEVRGHAPLVCFSVAMRTRSTELKTFLMHQLYRHPKVMHTTEQAKRIVAELFDAYSRQPDEMQAGFASRAHAGHALPAEDADACCARAVADYIAGMTDRFAAREHERLSGQRLLP